ncbi:C-GCAxxG-C-C family protein [uncultured Ruminococcus sp.]|uniref:C-GCAxxG-C-C family protein n=1 Tax=uncultured Ruminococcus sp. TaxID=165186 RepID=UPI0025E34834|nr:C-GCAxxG-C-C family protein [uncultured Ruminococcus sp.]
MMKDHSETACDLFAGGFNCAQSVFAAFSDVTGFDRDTALKLASGFGAGMGRMREVCGTFSAMVMVVDMLYGTGEEFTFEDKAAHYKLIQELAAQFREVHGTIICRELLQGLKVTSDPTPEQRTEKYYKVRPCIKFVRTAAEILDRYIAEHPVNNGQ